MKLPTEIFLVLILITIANGLSEEGKWDFTLQDFTPVSLYVLNVIEIIIICFRIPDLYFKKKMSSKELSYI